MDDRVKMLNQGQCTIHEPRLPELMQSGIRAGNLKFIATNSPNFLKEIKESEAYFLAVGTPEDENGRTRMEYIDSAAEMIAKLPGELKDKIVITKSTVPVGTGDHIEEVFKKHEKTPIVVSNPEFLKQGNAVADFVKPERVVIGTDNQIARKKLSFLYQPLMLRSDRIHLMSRRSAELVKYACNAFLATKISFINEIALLSEAMGADVREVRDGMITDSRIGSKFLYPGTGYGGSCFPKDVHSLINQASEQGIDLKISKATDDVNERQKLWSFEKLKKHFKNDFKGKTICLWGLSFKPNTDDLREAPSLQLVKKFVDAGAKIQAFDPEADRQAKMAFQYALDAGSMTLCSNPYEAAQDADALILLTEWKIFRSPNFKKLANALKHPLILDGRNIYDEELLKQYGISYTCIGVAKSANLRLMTSQGSA
jgi:UDPglucose 6-dehydrogenase